MAIEQKNIGQFKCNSCGGGFELHNKRSMYVSCPYCGSVADTTSDAFRILTKGVSPDKFKPRSFIKLGLSGKFKNEEYKVIGRTSWRNDYKEYWAEGGEAGYSDEKWTFDEWILIGESGAYLSIIEDDEGYSFTESFIPKYPIIPKGEQTKDFKQNKNKQVQEYGKSEILYFEGESTYLVNPGNVVNFSQYSDSGIDYIAEWRFHDNGEIKEVEFFKETNVARGSLLTAFNIATETQRTSSSRVKESYESKRTRKRIWALAAILNIIIGAYLISAHTSNSNHLYKFEYSAHEVVKQTGWTKVDSSWKSVTVESPKKMLIKPEDKYIKIAAIYKVPKENFEGRYQIYFKDSKGIIFEHTQLNYHYTLYQKTARSANNETSFVDYFDVSELTGEYTVGLKFEVPMEYYGGMGKECYVDEKVRNAEYIGAYADIARANSIKASIKPMSTNLLVNRVNSDYNGSYFIVFGVIMLIVSLSIRKGKKIKIE